MTFDASDLDVGMSVYDDSGPTPVLVAGPTAMLLVANYTYRGKFTVDLNKNYVIIKAVYTDDTYETLSPDYAQGSESVYAQYLTPPVQSVVGVIDCSGGNS